MIDTKERIFTDEVKKLVPVLGKDKAERLTRAYLIGDEETRERIFELVDVIKARIFSDKDLKNTVLAEPPPREQAGDGDLDMGDVLYGKKKIYPFRIDHNSLLTHLALFGSSGYGKTNIAYMLCERLSDMGVPIIIFDFSKRNYKDLLATRLKGNIDIYTIGREAAPFKFNPLVPPKGVLLSQWMKEFASIFDHAYWLLGGGRHIILKAIDDVYQRKDNPRLTDLKRWISEYGEEKLPARERNWLATAERPLESLCFKEIGDVFNCDVGITPDQFFRPGRITILELDALDTNDKTFFIEIVLQWIRDWMLVSQSREKLKGVVILEEAHHVLSRDKSLKLGSETVMDLVFREVRELGLGMIYIDQHPSLVSYPAIGNTSTHVYMNLGLDTKHASDILDSSNMLGLDYHDEGNYLRRLPVGHGFVLCRNAEFKEPFLVEFPFVPVPKGKITDEDITDHMKDKIDIQIEEEKQTIEKREKKKIEKELEDIPADDLDDGEWRIIQNLGEGQGSYASQIYKRAKMSGSVFNDKATRLIKIGAIGMRWAKIRRNKYCYYFLTEPGMRLFAGKFGKRDARMPLDLSDVDRLFQAAGWESRKEGDLLILSGADKETKILLADNLDYDLIYQRLSDPQVRHSLCATDRVKNMVIQQAARLSKKKNKSLVLFASTISEFEEKGEFERIEFLED
jgi:hypothetical protein